MKLKKMVIVSLSTMVFGSFFPSFVNVLGHTDNGYSVFAQEDKLATLAKIKTFDAAVKLSLSLLNTNITKDNCSFVMIKSQNELL